MQVLTNGRHFLDAISLINHTRSYPATAQVLPKEGTTLWWGFFRRGEKVRFHVSAQSGHAEARILDVNQLLLVADVAGSHGAELEIEAPADGIVYFRVDGRQNQSFEFSIDVVEPAPSVRKKRRTIRALSVFKNCVGV